MNNYFLFTGKDSPGGVASAFAPKDTKLAHDLMSDLDNVNEMPFEFNLVKLTVGRKGLIESDDLSGINEIWKDYQINSLVYPILSEKLKTIIENNLTGKEGIEWISAKINGNGEQRIYYILRFKKLLDVLDTEKTIFNELTGGVIIPRFSLEKVQNFSVFHRPTAYPLWRIPSGLYISDKLKKAIQKEKCTGVSFEKTMVS